jgi:hypothetical protein
VTLELLHHEYLEQHAGGLKYTALCERYRAWLRRRGLVMRQVHLAGDKLFVDYSGKKAHITDPDTGEVIEVELFVAVLGASNFTYAEATATQRSPDWIASHVRTLEYIGGAPAALICDQLKSGVARACRYEPQAQRTYEDLAEHYQTTVGASGATEAPSGQGLRRSRCPDRAALDPSAAPADTGTGSRQDTAALCWLRPVLSRAGTGGLPRRAAPMDRSTLQHGVPALA